MPFLTADQWTFIILALMGIMGSAVIPAFNDWRKAREAKPQRIADAAKTTADTQASQATTAESMASAAGQMMSNYKTNQAEMQADIDDLKKKAVEAVTGNTRQLAALKETFETQQRAFSVETDDLKAQVAGLKEQVGALTKINLGLQEQLKTMTDHNIALEQAAQINRETQAKLVGLRDQLNKLQATTEDAANAKPAT